MSRLPTGGRKASCPDTSVALRPVRGSRTARIFRQVLILAGLVCTATPTVLAQQVETVKSTRPVTCSGRSYQLQLVTAEGLVNAKSAKALAIVLVPDDRSASRIFSIYWFAAVTPAPTHRDNTNGGALGNKLISYGNGKDNKGVQVVDSFLAAASCLPSDPQVSGIQKVFDAQNLLDTIRDSDLTLKVIADQLNSQGVSSINSGQIQRAAQSNLGSLQSEIEFARAIRQSLPGLLNTEGRNNVPGGQSSRDEELRTLQETITQLRRQVAQANPTEPSYFGSPMWLIILFPLTALLSLIGIAVVGLAVYPTVRKRNADRKNGLDHPLPPEKRVPHLTVVSPSGEKPLKPEKDDDATHVVEAISKSLEPLAANIEELKKSIGSVETKLKEHALTQGLLEHIYQDGNFEGEREKLINELRESLGLYQLLKDRCGNDATQTNLTQEYLRSFLDQLDEINRTYFPTELNGSVPLKETIEKIKNRLDQDSNTIIEFSSVEESVRNFTGKDGNVSEAVTQLIDEQSAAREKLEQYHSATSLGGTVDDVVQSYEEITAQLRQAFPDDDLLDQALTGKGDVIKSLVTSLVVDYLELKPNAERVQEVETENSELKNQLDSANAEVEAGKQLVDELTVEFNFTSEYLKGSEDRISGTLNRLKDERESSVFLQLRMGLSSALIALDKAIEASQEHKDVMEAIYLAEIKEGIEILLAEMENCSGEQLWNKGLSAGFREKWLHYLVRAELLLRTYYADRKEFSFLREAVSLACSSILVALHEFQVEVIEVRLLDELPSEMDTEPVYPGLRNLPAVRERVRSQIMNTQTKGLVVDVTSFPYFVKGVQENRGRAAIANPSAWIQH